MEKFDLIIIGAGPGGYPAAIRAAQLGAKTAIIEKEELGGTCLNRGCIPTKTLIAGADVLEKIKNAAEFGIKVNEPEIDYSKMAARKDEVITKLRNGIAQLLSANGVQSYEGAASFLSRNRIEVTNGKKKTKLEADKIIIATGSVSTMPKFLPKSKNVVDSRGFLELDKLPKTLIVLGGGYIGCELACMAAKLGVEVTIVELLEDVLVLLDKDVRSEVKRHMTKDLNINILTGEALKNIKATAAGVSGTAGREKLKAEMLLASVGRSPVTQGLKLENAGIKLDDQGYIEVNDYNRTSAANIYAIGDVNGGPQLAHAATSQGIIAAENAITKTSRKNETIVPGVIFSSPEVALTGLTQARAKEEGQEVIIGKYHYQALGKALASNEPAGFVKWIVDAQTDQLLGAAVVGAHATDLIAAASVAIRNELTAEEIGHTIHAHPTFGEIWMEAAHAVHGKAIHAAPPRGLHKPTAKKRKI
ncbi:MAG: dihydrolipoyl dehydrogenase [Candidatus Omnitrophica bacterium]|nr:dihydrolipoyl dehydrogenase [Candidatus Omnitrophota bacterium]